MWWIKIAPAGAGYFTATEMSVTWATCSGTHDFDDVAISHVLVGADDGLHFRRSLQILHTSANRAHGGTGIRLNHSRRQDGHTHSGKRERIYAIDCPPAKGVNISTWTESFPCAPDAKALNRI